MLLVRIRVIEYLHFTFKSFAKPILLSLQVVANLQVEPESLRSPEVSRQTQSRVRADGARPMDDFINASRRYTYVLCEPILTNLEWFEKLVQKHLSRMDRL